MANTKTRKPMSSKSKGLIGLILLLALTVFVSCLAVGGMKLDQDGVRVLLPWVPVSTENWPASLPRSRALGGGSYLEYTVEGDDADKAVEVFKARLNERGITDAAVTLTDNVIRVELPELDEDSLAFVRSLLATNGKFEFRTEDGNVFMTGDDIKQTAVGYADASYTTLYLSLATTEEGKQKLADATTEHADGTIGIYQDGNELITAGVGGEPFTTGQISVPLGTDLLAVQNVGIQMKCGSFEAKLNLSDAGLLNENGAGNGARVWLIIAAVVLALALVVLIAKGKLSGVAAFWAVWCAVLLTMFLFATVIRSSLTVGCFIAVLAGIVLAAYVGYLRVVAIAKAARESGSAKQAVKLGFRTSMKKVWTALGAVLVLSIILMVIPAAKIVGYTLAAGVFSAAVALPLMHLFLYCFTAITGKTSLYGAAK